MNISAIFQMADHLRTHINMNNHVHFLRYILDIMNPKRSVPAEHQHILLVPAHPPVQNENHWLKQDASMRMNQKKKRERENEPGRS